MKYAVTLTRAEAATLISGDDAFTFSAPNGSEYILWIEKEDLHETIKRPRETKRSKIETIRPTDESNRQINETGRITRKKERSPERIVNRRSGNNCKHGHPWTAETTYMTKTGYKVCKECVRLRDARRRAGKREKRVYRNRKLERSESKDTVSNPNTPWRIRGGFPCRPCNLSFRTQVALAAHQVDRHGVIQRTVA